MTDKNQKGAEHLVEQMPNIEAAGILCGDRPCTICDSKAVSLSYSILDAEGNILFPIAKVEITKGLYTVRFSYLICWMAISNVSYL